MEPFEDVVYDDRAVYLQSADTLVLADLHVGRDASSDVELPMGEGTDLAERLAAVLERHEPSTVVVAGDLLHSFGTVPYGVPKTLDRLESTVAAADADLTVVTGNHDTILEDIADIETRPVLELDAETVVHHGHERPGVQANRYVIGHEHPAIYIEGDRHPCFLECRNQHDGAAVLVLPAFNRFAVGTVVNELSARDCMSPLLVNMDDCRPVVRTADQTLSFPGLGTLRSHL